MEKELRNMSRLTVSHLACEYRTHPLGIDVLRPRLSWQLHSDRRGARQAAYRVLAASSERDLAGNSAFLWDSGRIESDQSIHVPYGGPALASGRRAYWKVRVWDEAGNGAESSSAWWEMGLLARADWTAQWIGAPFYGGPRTASPAPFLRKEFALRESIAAARLYATAIGLYECHLNGVRVGDALFTPGWTDYFRRVQYQTYDVTDILRTGANAFGIILGDGWGVGHIAWLGRQHYADRPRCLAQIVVTYSDGGREIIATDGSWKVAQGPILESDMLMGESYDARRELAGWSKAGYNDASWWPAEAFADRGAALVAASGPAVKRQETLRPTGIHKVPGLRPRWIFDMGQNMVGWVRLAVRGEKGTTVAIRYAEALNPDGTLYTANLRTARSTDHYTLKGDENEVWEPRFTFHGFRYVELSGFPGVPTGETVAGIVVHSEMASIGAFECSDPLINRLQHNIVWGQKGNFLDVPTDCPQRDERLGWTGDAQVFIRTAAFNQDVAGFFTKWTRDLEDSQYPNGAFPSVAPNLPAWSIGEGGPAWADSGVICPWTMYLCYGDVRLLEERYASMRRFLEFLDRTSRDGLRCFPDYAGWHGNGDWLALDGSDGREGGTSKELIGTAFFAYSARLMADIARVLGKSEDESGYRAMFKKARAAFQKRFVRADGTIEGGTQTSYVLALQFDLLPPALRAPTAAELVRNIRERGDHLSTGFVGTPYINWVLCKTGHADTAYALLNQTAWPSWLYPVTQGATTIWERWDGWTREKGFQDPKMNSFNHYAFGAVGAWIYAMIAGIDLDPDQPGFKHILMNPHPGSGLTRAAAELHSPYGTIRSAWSLDNDRFTWKIAVPANSTATIHVPAKDESKVMENGQPSGCIQGVTFLRMDERSAVFRLESGRYFFSSCIG
jgi:alpha-L-rhamnosidase